jgi:Predicted secreted protein
VYGLKVALHLYKEKHEKNLSIMLILLLASCFESKQSDDLSTPITHITTHAGNQFIFSLPARYSAGYKWMLTHKSFNTSFLKMIDDTYAIEHNALIGGQGTQTFIFKALEKGDATITLFYKRPWEKTIEQTHTIQVTIE